MTYFHDHFRITGRIASCLMSPQSRAGSGIPYPVFCMPVPGQPYRSVLVLAGGGTHSEGAKADIDGAVLATGEAVSGFQVGLNIAGSARPVPEIAVLPADRLLDAGAAEGLARHV